MTRLLLLGCGPLPADRSRRHAAPGLRAWQLCRALLDGGHQVSLVTFGGGPSRQPAGAPGLTRICLAPGDFTDGKRLNEVLDQARPDAVITAASYQPTRAACLLDSELPFWFDLPGDMMAEAQLRAESSGEPDRIWDYLSILRPALERGDHFSVISNRQRHALVGQLGFVGRLGADTVGHELVSVLPPAVEPAPRVVLQPRPDSIPPDAFLVASSGGFNTWCDVETLVAGLALAMEQDPRIHFVAAGGPIEDHCEGAAARLRELIEASPHGAKFHLLGWLWPEDLAALYAGSQLAVNMDRACYEAELGSRNRLLDWLRHGLPCLTTPCCELARELCDLGLANETAAGDPEAMAARILELAATPDALTRQGADARQEVERRYTPASTTGPLLAWAGHPTRAPASAAATTSAQPDAQHLAAELRRSEEQLKAIRASVAFRGLRRVSSLLDPVRHRLKGPKN